MALQNPNPTPVDVILQSQNSLSPLDSQTTVTVPPGAMVVYSNGGGAETGLLAFSSLPVRMLGLGFPSPNAGIYPAAPFPALPPVKQLAASPVAVSFQWQSGTAVPAPVSVSLSAAQNSLRYFSFQLTSPAAPFSVTSTRTVSPATLTVAVNPVGLSPETYTGNLVVTPQGPNATITTIPLSLTVSPAALLKANPQTLTFSSDYTQNLRIESNGSPIAFTVAASDGAGPHWLTVTPSGGTTPAQLSVTVNSTNLSEGVYNGQIVITGPNNTVTVPVQLSALASSILSFSPPSVTFSVRTASDPPPPRTVLVYGPSTGAAFSASTSSGGPWLSASITTSGQLGAVITANPAGLKAGTYNGTVTLTSPASPFPARFPVSLVVWDQEPVLTVTPSSVTYTTSLYENLNTPSPPVVHVDSGGIPLNFTVGGTPGVWWTPASIPAYAGTTGVLGTSEYDITITAGTQKVIVPVTTIVTTSSRAPPFMGSVVNAAAQFPGSVAPGEILSIYGFGAGPSNPAGFTLDPSGKVATSLNGAQVLFDGRPAPIIYGSASQANVIVPYEVAGQPATTIALQFAGVTSAAWTIPVATSAPGIFTLDSSGQGQAAVLNQDNSVNGATNPAARGSIIQIYATGEGQTSPRGVTGSVIGSDLKTPVLQVKVTIGGQDAFVQYSGSAGDSIAGLLQVNAVVPQAVAPGGAVPVSVSIGGSPYQRGVTIAVQ